MIGKLFFLSLIVLVISVIVIFLIKPSLVFYEKDLKSKQVELRPVNKTSVLHVDGKLYASGWARNNEHFHFNPNRINPSTSIHPFLNSLRYKKWEAFVFIHKDFVFSSAIFDL